MTIEVRCRKCGEVYQLSDSAHGKKVRCQECEAAIDVSASVVKTTSQKFARSSRTSEESYDDPDDFGYEDEYGRQPLAPNRSTSRSSQGSSSFPLKPLVAVFACVMATILIGTIVMSFLPDSGQSDEWITWQSPDELFSVSLPSEPDVSSKPVKGLTATQYKCVNWTSSIVITRAWNMMLLQIRTPEQVDQIFKTSVESLKAENDKIILSEAPHTVQDFPARIVEVAAAEGSARTKALLILKNEQFFVVEVVSRSGPPDEKIVSKVFDSFRFIIPETELSKAEKSDFGGVETSPDAADESEYTGTSLSARSNRRGRADRKPDPATPTEPLPGIGLPQRTPSESETADDQPDSRSSEKNPFAVVTDDEQPADESSDNPFDVVDSDTGRDKDADTDDNSGQTRSKSSGGRGASSSSKADDDSTDDSESDSAASRRRDASEKAAARRKKQSAGQKAEEHEEEAAKNISIDLKSYHFAQAAQIRAQKKDRAEAFANAEKAEQLGPDRRNRESIYEWHAVLGETYFLTQQYRKCAEHCQKALKNPPEGADTAEIQSFLEEAQKKIPGGK